jgi:hypothetical protein
MQIVDLDHLKKMNVSWLTHMTQAFKISFCCAAASLLCFFHGCFPFLFYRSATDIINHIKENLLDERTIS